MLIAKFYSTSCDFSVPCPMVVRGTGFVVGGLEKAIVSSRIERSTRYTLQEHHKYLPKTMISVISDWSFNIESMRNYFKLCGKMCDIWRLFIGIKSYILVRRFEWPGDILRFVWVNIQEFLYCFWCIFEIIN